MSVYILVQLDIHHLDGYKQYAQGARPIMADYQCEVVVVDEAVKVLEGTWSGGKIVMIRFDCEAEALRWYNSPEYQAVAKFRLDSATTNMVLIHGRN